MSTRSSIAFQKPDGSVIAVYCHFDGYLEGVGAALLAGHNDAGKAEALVALGDLSQCSQKSGVVAYARDRGEKFEDTKPHAYPDFETYLTNAPEEIGDNGYRYVWTGGEWKAWGKYGGLGHTPQPLSVAVEKAKAQKDVDAA